jgi:hypothetical protein
MNIYLDIETCPGQATGLRDEFTANVKAPAQYKKPESIAEWMKENAEAEAEQAWRKTSFDGAHGHVCVVGLAFDDERPITMFNPDWLAAEAGVLRSLFNTVDDYIAKQPNVRPTFIGHNLVEFDLRFLFHRAVVLGVKPSHHIPFFAKPWDDGVFDTMVRWAGVKDRVKLEKLAKVLGVGTKGDMDGSKVWDYVRDGRIAEVADYCANDVVLTRAVHKRMIFAEAA